MKTKGRLLSFFLAVLMVASVLTVFQPIVAEAAGLTVPSAVTLSAIDVTSESITMRLSCPAW